MTKISKSRIDMEGSRLDGVGKLTISSTNGIIFSDNSSVTTAPSGFRNRIINGDHTVDQINVGSAYTIVAGAARQPIIDMFYSNCTGANVSGQQITATDSTKRFRYTGAASVTAINHDTAISAANSRDLASKTVTLSAKLSNSLLTTVTWTTYYANTTETFGTIASPTRTLIATSTFTVTSSETTYAVQIAIPAAATTGLEIVLSVGAQTSGTWTIGDVQLELGTIAASGVVVERVEEGEQLRRCKRVFQKTYDLSVVPGSIVYPGVVCIFSLQANRPYQTSKFEVEMRSTPTIVIYSPTSGAVGVADTGISIGQDFFSTKGITYYGIGTIGTGGALFHYTAAARLMT
jgi:hypothetical protein